MCYVVQHGPKLSTPTTPSAVAVCRIFSDLTERYRPLRDPSKQLRFARTVQVPILRAVSDLTVNYSKWFIAAALGWGGGVHISRSVRCGPLACRYNRLVPLALVDPCVRRSYYSSVLDRSYFLAICYDVLVVVPTPIWGMSEMTTSRG